MSVPLVSIICMTYNHEKFIRETIESLLMQKTDFDFEIIIHDDASVDGTVDIIRQYARAHPDVFVPILQEENQYSQGNRFLTTVIVPRARGKYIAFCEGDDYWTDPLKLQKQIDYMRAHPQCSLCVHACDYIYPDKTRKEYKPYKESQVVPVDAVIGGGGSFCHTASIVTQTLYLKNMPDYYYTVPVGDYPMQLFFASCGETYYFADNMSAYRYNVPSSWTSRMRGNYPALVQLQNGIIQMLQEFELATQHRYREAVEKKIKAENFSLLEYEQDYCAMTGPEYKECFCALPLKQRIKIRIGKRMPKLLSLFRSVTDR